MKNNDCDLEIKDSTQFSVDNAIEEYMIRKRQILIVGQIDDNVATYVNLYLQYFNTSRDPVFMIINSSGGDMSAGYSIIDQMSLCGFPIFTIVKGNAHSMGAILAIHGTPRMRYMTTNSSMMLHQAQIHHPMENVECTNVTQGFVYKDYNKKISNLSKKTKLSAKQLHELIKNNLWMTPKEAIQYGMIDGVWNITMENKFVEVYNV